MYIFSEYIYTVCVYLYMHLFWMQLIVWLHYFLYFYLIFYTEDVTRNTRKMNTLVQTISI